MSVVQGIVEGFGLKHTNYVADILPLHGRLFFSNHNLPPAVWSNNKDPPYRAVVRIGEMLFREFCYC